MRVYFMRHGESEQNARGLYAAENETPLTGRGREQAGAATADAERYQIDTIIASDQSRALDTALIIRDAIEVPVERLLTDQRLREVHVGMLAGAPNRGFSGYFAHQEQPGDDVGVETVEQVAARMKSLLADLPRLAAGSQNLLLVGHSNSGIILKALISGSTGNLEQSQALPNAQIFHLTDLQEQS